MTKSEFGHKNHKSGGAEFLTTAERESAEMVTLPSVARNKVKGD
jgi:hypothetical protein